MCDSCACASVWLWARTRRRSIPRSSSAKTITCASPSPHTRTAVSAAAADPEGCAVAVPRSSQLVLTIQCVCVCVCVCVRVCVRDRSWEQRCLAAENKSDSQTAQPRACDAPPSLKIAPKPSLTAPLSLCPACPRVQGRPTSCRERPAAALPQLAADDGGGVETEHGRAAQHGGRAAAAEQHKTRAVEILSSESPSVLHVLRPALAAAAPVSPVLADG